MGYESLAGVAGSYVSNRMTNRDKGAVPGVGGVNGGENDDMNQEHSDPNAGSSIAQKLAPMMGSNYLGTQPGGTGNTQAPIKAPWESGISDVFGNRMAKRFSGVGSI